MRAVTAWCICLVAALPACGTTEQEPPDSAAAAPPAAAPVDRWTVSPTAAGPVRIGMTANEALAALGMARSSVPREECEYLNESAPVDFMVVNDTVVRFDVRDSSVHTPEGIGVGDTAARVHRAYPGRVVVTPHKYTDGTYLTVTPLPDTMLRFVFETDSGRVSSWRSGRMPSVIWVEGCS